MNRKRTAPLPEYPGTEPALIEPSRTCPKGVRLPSRAVLCFFADVLRELAGQPDVEIVHTIRTEIGEQPILRIGRGKKAVALMQPGIGAPLSAMALEKFIALGARSVIACGGAGVLDSSLSPGTVIIPTRALRDEGTSYHYQPRSRTNRPHAEAVEAIKRTCRQHDIPFVTGTTWTTDGVFRETPRKIRSRRREGCLTVEMEAATFFAVARFRGIRFAQLLYAGDDVSGEKWDPRRWEGRSAVRERLLMLAIEAARNLSP